MHARHGGVKFFQVIEPRASFIVRVGSWLAVLAMARSVAAVGEVAVRCTGLAAGSQVYVDGHFTTIKKGALHLAPGEHLVQIESFQPPPPLPPQEPPERVALPSGVWVFRTCINVVAGQVLTLAVRPVPVLTTNAAYATMLGAPAGPPGVTGPPGRPADGHRQLDPAAARALLQESLLLRLEDLENECEVVAGQHDRYAQWMAPPPVLWYSPHGERADPVPVLGPQGPQGKVGVGGLPGDVKRVQDEQGQLLLTRLLAEWKLDELQNQLTQLSHRSHQLTPPAYNVEPLASIPIYTPAWRRRLDDEYARFTVRDLSQRPSQIAGLPPNPLPEPVGAAGRPGPDGDVPPSAQAADFNLHLPEPEVERLFGALKADTTVANRWQQVQEHIQRLNQQTVADEEREAREPQCASLSRAEATAEQTATYPGLEVALQRKDEAALRMFYNRFVDSLDIKRVPQAYGGALRNLLDADPLRRQTGLETLSATGEVNAIPWIVPSLDTSDAALRVKAGSALERLVAGLILKQRERSWTGQEAVRPQPAADIDLRPLAWVVQRMLQDRKDANLQSYAATMIGYIGLREFTPELQAMLNSRHPAVSNSAEYALKQLQQQPRAAESPSGR